MRDAFETRLPLVIRRYDIPGCVFRIGCLQHAVAGARVVVPSLSRGQIHRTELPLAQRVFDAGFESSLLLLVAHLEPVLDQHDPAIDDILLDHRAEFKGALVLFLCAETHDVFDAETVVPTAVPNDDFTSRREVRHVPLNVHLGLLAIGRRGERHEAEYTWADALGDGANCAAFPSPVAALKDDHDPQTFVFYPVLKPTEFRLKSAQLFLVFLALKTSLAVLVVRFAHRLSFNIILIDACASFKQGRASYILEESFSSALVDHVHPLTCLKTRDRFLFF